MNAISMSINIPVWISTENIKMATHEDAYLQELKTYIIKGWPHKKEEVAQGKRQYFPMGNRLAMIDCIAMKGKRIIFPFQYRNRYCSSCTATIW